MTTEHPPEAPERGPRPLLTRKEGWDRRAPFVIRLEHGTYEIEHRPWIDHVYRLDWNGTRVYVSEPYHLTTDDMEDLIRLQLEGWDLQIDGRSAHHPATIRICLVRPGFKRFPYEVPAL